MKAITSETPLQEIAALVSTALEDAGLVAILGGGGAVTFYSENQYMSTDLDFVTVESVRAIEPVLARLGFRRIGREFDHPDSPYFLEFPAGPLAFGDRYVDSSTTAIVETTFGRLRIITATQCVLDRLAWWVHGRDPQALEQAVLVARRQSIDWEEVHEWARTEKIDSARVEEVRAAAQLPGAR